MASEIQYIGFSEDKFKYLLCFVPVMIFIINYYTKTGLDRLLLGP
jgi:hypothetical protein